MIKRHLNHPELIFLLLLTEKCVYGEELHWFTIMNHLKKKAWVILLFLIVNKSYWKKTTPYHQWLPSVVWIVFQPSRRDSRNLCQGALKLLVQHFTKTLCSFFSINLSPICSFSVCVPENIKKQSHTIGLGDIFYLYQEYGQCVCLPSSANYSLLHQMRVTVVLKIVPNIHWITFVKPCLTHFLTLLFFCWHFRKAKCFSTMVTNGLFTE